MDHKSQAECERIMDFIEDTFHEIRLNVPYRRPHFRVSMYLILHERKLISDSNEEGRDIG
jgi:hypothetical protein